MKLDIEELVYSVLDTTPKAEDEILTDVWSAMVDTDSIREIKHFDITEILKKGTNEGTIRCSVSVETVSLNGHIVPGRATHLYSISTPVQIAQWRVKNQEKSDT